MTEYQKGIEIVQDLIKKRWVPEILHSIKLGNKTYTNILNSIEYLSQTELQRKLKILEEYEAINKNEKDLCYDLTEFGNEIDHLFQHVYELGQKYLRRDKI